VGAWAFALQQVLHSSKTCLRSTSISVPGWGSLDPVGPLGCSLGLRLNRPPQIHPGARIQGSFRTHVRLYL